MKSVTISFLKEPVIWSAAEEKLKEFDLEGILPVPVEQVVEQMGLDIIPVPGLKRSFGVDGFTTHDKTEVRVDDGMYGGCEVRFRFTLAHELGHMILYPFLFDESLFTTIEEWKLFMKDGVSQKEYGWMEYQAYSFAGYFLVPRSLLYLHFEGVLPQVTPMIEEVQKQGIEREQYLSSVIGHVARMLRPVFDVSDEVLERRIKADGLVQMIP